MVYPLNREVLMVPVDKEGYSPIRILKCSPGCLLETGRALARFWKTLDTSYKKELNDNDVLVALFQELQDWDYASEDNIDELRQKCSDLVRVWCDMKLYKQLLSRDNTMVPFSVVAQPRSEPPTTPHHSAYYDSNFDLLAKDLNTPREATYNIHTVSPVELNVEFNPAFAVTKQFSIFPVEAGSPEAEKFWDTDSTLRIIELFVRDYENHSEFRTAEILSLLEPLRHIFYNTGAFELSYGTISTDATCHYYYACCLILFCKFLLAWQTPCLNNPECELRPSAVERYHFRRRRSRV